MIQMWSSVQRTGNDKSFILYVYSSVNPPHQNFAIHVWTIRQPRENLLSQQCRRWNRCKLLIIMQSFFRWLPSDFVCISNFSWAHAELAHFIVWYLQYRYRVIGQNLSSSDISPPSFKIFSPGMTALTFFLSHRKLKVWENIKLSPYYGVCPEEHFFWGSHSNLLDIKSLKIQRFLFLNAWARHCHIYLKVLPNYLFNAFVRHNKSSICWC